MGLEILIGVAVGAAIGGAVGHLAAFTIAGIVVGAIAGAGVGMMFGGSQKKPDSGQPDFGGGGDLSGSPTYGRFGPMANTITDKLPVPVPTGRVKMAGNIVWQSEPDTSLTHIVVLGQGEIDDVEEIRINDRPYQQFDGCDAEVRLGTKDQAVCKLVTDADAGIEGMNLRGYAHIAVKQKQSDELSGAGTVTCVVRGRKCQLYNEAYHKISHPLGSGDAVKPINSSEVTDNDGIYQVIQAPDNIRLADIEIPLSWYEGTEPAEFSNDWSIDNKAYLQVYKSDGSIPTGAMLWETSRVDLRDVSAMNRGSDFYDYNMMRFNLPPEANLTSGDNYAFVIKTDYAKGLRKACIHVLGDFTSTIYPKTAGYGNAGTYTPFSGGSLSFRMNAYKSNAQGWSNGPYWTRNPAAIIREVLLNKNWGGSKPSGDLNDVDFGKAYDYYKALVGDGNGHYEPRFEIDFLIDSLRPGPDHLEDLAASCLSYYVRQGNRISLKVLASGDSAHNFGDGSNIDVNNYDNIKEGSFRWRVGSLDDLPNRTIVHYTEPGEKWNESTVEFNDRIDQESRDNVIPDEISLMAITRRSQAIRIGKYHQLKAKYANVELNWTGFLDANHVEIGDPVSLWHKAGLYSAKKIRVTSKINNADGSIDFVGEDYYDSLYDPDGIRAPRRTAVTGPNIFTSLGEVTNLTATEIAIPQGTFGINGDGRIVSNISLNWDVLSDDQQLRMRHHRVIYSIDGGATFVEAGTTAPDVHRFALLDCQIGKTYLIKVKTVSVEGRSSNGATISILAEGKNNPPSDVQNFSVNIVGKELVFTWQQVTDADLQGYEIRVGETWETAAVLDTYITGTIYRSLAVLTGPRTYHIKAIDYSQNYSANESSDTINITSLPDSNIVLTHDEWQRIGLFMTHPQLGTVHQSGDFVMIDAFSSQYFRRAFQPKTQMTWQDIDGLGLTCEQAETHDNTKNFDQPLFTGPVTYETQGIEIGAGELVVGNLILDHLTSSEAGGPTVIVEYATSNDGVTWSAYVNFTQAEIVTRYIKFRITLQTDDANTYIRLLGFKAVLDVPDITDQGKDVTVPITGVTVNFNVTFVLAPKTVVATTVDTNTTKVPDISAVTKTGFVLKLRDKTDALVAGKCNWFAKGAGGVS